MTMLGITLETTTAQQYNKKASYEVLARSRRMGSKASKQEIASAEKIVEIDRHSFGDDHPDTLGDMVKLARVYREHNQPRKARDVLERVVQVRTRLFGADDYSVQRDSNLLGMVLCDLGEFASARAVQNEILSTIERIYGSDSELAVTVKLNLSRTLRALGHFEEAARLETGVVDTHRRLYGDDHLETLRARSGLARVKRESGDYESAKSIDLDVLDRAKSCDFDLPFILAAKRHLIEDYFGLKDIQSALDTWNEVFDDATRHLEPDDEFRQYVEKQNRRFRRLRRAIESDYYK
jgi:tetratricopeptide (TPR) repeat protein